MASLGSILCIAFKEQRLGDKTGEVDSSKRKKRDLSHVDPKNIRFNVLSLCRILISDLIERQPKTKRFWRKHTWLDHDVMMTLQWCNITWREHGDLTWPHRGITWLVMTSLWRDMKWYDVSMTSPWHQQNVICSHQGATFNVTTVKPQRVTMTRLFDGSRRDLT